MDKLSIFLSDMDDLFEIGLEDMPSILENISDADSDGRAESSGEDEEREEENANEESEEAEYRTEDYNAEYGLRGLSGTVLYGEHESRRNEIEYYPIAKPPEQKVELINYKK